MWVCRHHVGEGKVRWEPERYVITSGVKEVQSEEGWEAGKQRKTRQYWRWHLTFEGSLSGNEGLGAHGGNPQSTTAGHSSPHFDFFALYFFFLFGAVFSNGILVSVPLLLNSLRLSICSHHCSHMRFYWEFIQGFHPPQPPHFFLMNCFMKYNFVYFVKIGNNENILNNYATQHCAD